tara:strand:- start:8280 stop:9590 length:1311 start_codon:yes stop_codon:yes gene_type:complete
MSEIDKIQFGIVSAEYIKQSSVVEVTTHELYEKNVPKSGGPNDLRLGTVDRSYLCQTCKGDALKCPGHFGHIVLAQPMYHISFIKTVTKVLQSICFHCSRLKCEISNVPKGATNSYKFKMNTDLCKSKSKCFYCEEVQPKILLESLRITVDGELLSAKKAYEMLCMIPKEDYELLGFNAQHSKPQDMIITVLTVPPPHVRPSVMMDASMRSQDDLTHKLCDILKANANLYKQLNNDNPQIVAEFVNYLQFHVTTYIDNNIPGQPQATQRTGRPLKAICQRLKSKEGRVRGNIMGKRVDYSARTVITADPLIDLDQLGVPFKMTSNLTFPEKVTNFNKHILQEYVKTGPEVQFGTIGAKYVDTKAGVQKDLRFVKDTLTLEIGDVVHRHLKDGDVVLFNRQPSLHKMSMMAHKIVVMQGETFRMNLSATTPYNADFD